MTFTIHVLQYCLLGACTNLFHRRMNFSVFALCALCLLLNTVAFNAGGSSRRISTMRSTSSITMEYIPDGMSKAQWEKLKKKESEANKGKDLGAVGITKFKSRSFEAWQKSGGVNLFPVDPNTPLEERPYMQRTGGKADGSDLKARGLKARGQGIGSKRLSVDDQYDEKEAAGELRSTTFQMPWTKAATSKIKAGAPDALSGRKGITRKGGVPNKNKAKPTAKAAPVLVVKKSGGLFGSFGKKKAPEPEPEPEPVKPKKKGLFGF